MDKEKLIQNLKTKGFQVECFETGKEAAKFMENSISGRTIGIGGSLTVKETGIDQALMENNTVYWHWLPECKEEFGGAKEVRDMAMTTDIYISSVNAISQQGEIVNIDGTGNRIASTCYGHKEVYFIIGKNKITEDLESAIWRARNVAAPKNAQRLGQKTPCAVKADKCYDCNCPERICNGFLVLERPMKGMEMTVILVDEDLGA